jgi:hypothetical protein
MATYYVDATGGNDGDTGLSPGAAWQTIGHVNGETFVAGDSILFKRGETWTATQLTITWSGAVGNPITFADYDTGNKPIIDGNDAVNCIANNGVRSNITIQNFECTQGLDFGISFNGACFNILVEDCDCHDCGNDNLIFQNGVFDSTVTRGTFYNAYQRVGGTQPSGIEIADGCYDILIEGSICFDNGDVVNNGVGINIISHALTDMPYNVTVQNVDCYGNNEAGIYVLKQDATVNADSNILIQDGIFDDNDDYGIRMTYSGAAVLRGVSVLRCQAVDNADYGTYCKGRDISFERVIVATLTAGLGAARFEDCVDPICYNCTFYKGFDAPAGDQEALRTFGAAMDGFVMRNCIVTNRVAGVANIQVVNSAANFDIDYTLYWVAQANGYVWLGNWYTFANWQINTGMDANSPAPADPLFLDASAENFYLDHGSPALQVGTPLTGIPFYGDAPECGRWEMRWKSVRSDQRLRPEWKFA